MEAAVPERLAAAAMEQPEIRHSPKASWRRVPDEFAGLPGRETVQDLELHSRSPSCRWRGLPAGAEQRDRHDPARLLALLTRLRRSLLAGLHDMTRGSGDAPISPKDIAIRHLVNHVPPLSNSTVGQGFFAVLTYD